MSEKVRYGRMKIADMMPAEYNPRKDLAPGDFEWEKIERSLDSFGMVETIVWNERTGRIVGGHQRAKILASKGVEMVDVSIVNLNDEDEKILCVLLNKSKGQWESEKLASLLTEIKEATGSIESTGFEEYELDALIQDYDHIGNLLEDDFSDLGRNESSTFSVTFVFPKEYEEQVQGFIEKNGKQPFIDMIIAEGGEDACESDEC